MFCQKLLYLYFTSTTPGTKASYGKNNNSYGGKNQLPRFRAGTEVDLSAKDIKIDNGRTEPPQHLKEGELVDLMDKNGVGTDASMAGHIDNVVAR